MANLFDFSKIIAETMSCRSLKKNSLETKKLR